VLNKVKNSRVAKSNNKSKSYSALASYNKRYNNVNENFYIINKDREKEV
jgi:hypothetical protein